MKKFIFSVGKRNKLFKVTASTTLTLCLPAIASANNANANNIEMSQQKADHITGTVTDINGEPVIGATIKIVGSGSSIVTDMNGNFTLSVARNAEPQISSIGCVTKRVAVASNNITVVLAEDRVSLDEVVVLGYGAGQRKQGLSASVGVINNAGRLSVHPVNSTEGMLQGQLAGVTITANGGDPTSAPNIVIRGQGSMNGDSVLWAVDGIPGAPILSMNDIESIVVLKDAASAAIYGAQSGAGDCVLVTTKRAEEGKVSLSYDGLYGSRQTINLPKALTAEEQIKLAKISYKATGLDTPIGWDIKVNPYIVTNHTDWMDEVFRSAFYQGHNVVIDTGTSLTRSRLSYAYDGDDGVLIGTFNKRHTIYYSGQFGINKWMAITEDFTWRDSQMRGTNIANPEGGVIMDVLHMPSSASIYNPDGTYGGVSEPGNGHIGIHGDAISPMRILCANNAYDRTSDMWSTASLQLHNIVPGLKFASRFSSNIENNFYKEFTPTRPESGEPQLFNDMNESVYRYKKWMTENTLTYDNSFGKHNLGLLLSTTANKLAQRGVNVNTCGFSDEAPALQYLAYVGTTISDDYLIGPDASVACITRASYSYDDYYFLTASWRRDYASHLLKDSSYGDFPAFTGVWKISNESWFTKNKDLNLLKFRASWGYVDNLGSISHGYKAAQLSSAVWSEGTQYGVISNTLWGTLIYSGTALNPSLTWETSEQWGLGLDAAMFNNRLSLGFDYFNKRTYDLIQQQSVGWPSAIGLDAMLVNSGEVKSEGVEVQAAWSDQASKDFSYYINGNFAWLKSRVTGTGTYDEKGNPGIWVGDVYGHNDFKNLTNLFQTAQGQALNSFHLIRTDGIFQSDEEAAAYVDKDGKRIQPNAKAGDLKFIDANKDGKIDDKDRQYCGSSMPKAAYALTAGSNWKGLSVSAMSQGVSGTQALLVGKHLTLSNTEDNLNRWDKILDVWSPENRGSDIPRISRNGPNGNFTISSDWHLESASYLRLKNLTIKYDFTDFIQKWGYLNDRKSSLYAYFGVENALTITKYSDMDPEVGGFDTMKYPLSRVLSLGIKITY